jgi:hypothetical protein
MGTVTMEQRTITIEQLKSLVALAARAPSGDNTQPWTFSWDGRILTVFFDPTKAHHVLDAGLSAPTISLGAVMESVAIAASAYELSTDSSFLGLQQGKQCAVAQISLRKDGKTPDSLIDALPKRNTDRRLFQKGPMPRKELTEVWEGFDQRDSVHVHFVDSIPRDLYEYIVAAENLVSLHPTIFLDTVPWIRFSEGEIARTNDGMPWRGAGISPFQYPALRLIRSFPAAFPLASRGMRHVYSRTVQQLLRSSAGLFCISVRNPGPSALVGAGRLTMRLWLRLTQLAYGVQPLTISSLSLYNRKIGVLDEKSEKLFGTGYAEGENVMRRAFSIPAESMPVWMFRTGRSSALPAAWFTRRKGLESILQITSQQ